MKFKWSFVISLCILLFVSILIVPASPAMAQSTDRDALIALYNSTDGDNWTNKTNWLLDNVCTWYGVTCEGNRVKTLILSANQLSGTIPPEIGNLTNLQELTLSRNQLSGPIPPEIGNLTNLTKLDLSSNQLSGAIPPEMGNLDNLQTLVLLNNQLSGPIPPEMGNLGNPRFGSQPVEWSAAARNRQLDQHGRSLSA